MTKYVLLCRCKNKRGIILLHFTWIKLKRLHDGRFYEFQGLRRHVKMPQIQIETYNEI